MAFLFAGIAILIVLLVLARGFVAADPRALVRALRYIVGIGMMVFGGALILARRWELGVPLIAAGFSAMTLGRIGPIDLGGSRRTAGG